MKFLLNDFLAWMFIILLSLLSLGSLAVGIFIAVMSASATGIIIGVVLMLVCIGFAVGAGELIAWWITHKNDP